MEESIIKFTWTWCVWGMGRKRRNIKILFQRSLTLCINWRIHLIFPCRDIWRSYSRSSQLKEHEEWPSCCGWRVMKTSLGECVKDKDEEEAFRKNKRRNGVILWKENSWFPSSPLTLITGQLLHARNRGGWCRGPGLTSQGKYSWTEVSPSSCSSSLLA